MPAAMNSVAYDRWIGGRTVAQLGSNAGARPLAFQTWRHFKEAFSPELVARAAGSLEGPVRRCVDPCSGSGTTALACQFLGIEPVAIEVNPYLADLTEAKLTEYDMNRLAADVSFVITESEHARINCEEILGASAPKTLVEPGVGGRWVFDVGVADRILALRQSIDSLSDAANQRLMKVLLGGLLVELSNVVVNGKGRRYRSGWKERIVSPDRVFSLFLNSIESAVRDINVHQRRPTTRYGVLRGDARKLIREIPPVDLAVFSPPYPNSFDYTDVYNLELWMLGYFHSGVDNMQLRNATLTSHVQLKRKYHVPEFTSPTLSTVLEQLDSRRKELWHPDIPRMIGGYFADLSDLLMALRRKLRNGGRVFLVVGDSRYAGVAVPVADILVEIAPQLCFEVLEAERFRSMRASSQQGGNPVLPETLLVLG